MSAFFLFNPDQPAGITVGRQILDINEALCEKNRLTLFMTMGNIEITCKQPTVLLNRIISGMTKAPLAAGDAEGVEKISVSDPDES